MRRSAISLVHRRRGIMLPLAANAQPGQRMRRIGVLMILAADDPLGQPASLRSALGCLNWVGRRRNVADRTLAGPGTPKIGFRIDPQNWVAHRARRHLAATTPGVQRRYTGYRTVPIASWLVVDPFSRALFRV